MVDIDERVVSMKFDSSDFEKNTKSTMSILDKLREKLSFKDVSDSNSLDSISDNVQKMADKAYTIVDRMIDKIKDNIANKLVNFLQDNTIGQFKAGWEKYADMTTSVATLSSQGYAMSRINEQLSRLNYFTDETSYNFTAMVSEIGKFTASGQSLEDATTAMMGIAEWAALSGKNANEASRAMYQLSQALGSGTMRLIDYKSIQNLNMDTVEFRKNAIEAAIAAGTLKDNLNGTFTSLIDNKTTFAIQNFAESLSGKWFNSKVMMDTYKKYSDAVDEIREVYEQGSFINIAGGESTFNTTADAVKAVKENNKLLIKKFEETDLGSEEIEALLKKWKKVEKVTEVTTEEYEAMDDAAKEQLKTLQKQQQLDYADYLKEYGEVFKSTEKDAEEALEDWHTYVSSYGIKAFESAQEAKTFRDAIESAKDAASTVWTTIYTEIFGNYQEAKELWTDLANALYDIFVMRLWDIEGIFSYWKEGYEADKKAELEELKKEYDSLGKNNSSLDAYGRQRLQQLKIEITEMERNLELGLYDGRRILFQGLYAFGSGLKSAIENFRNAWNELFEENESGKKLIAFSEKVRRDGFRFFTMMKELSETDFFKNIAIGIKNLFAPINAVKEVIKSVIGFFLPMKDTVKNVLLSLSEGFKNITTRLVPAQETLSKLARILRGVVSVIRLVAKAIYAAWTTFVKPILDVIFDAVGAVVDIILTMLANLADAFFVFEDAIEPMEALQIVTNALRKALEWLWTAIKAIAGVIWDILSPALAFVISLVKDLAGRIKKLFAKGGGNAVENIANGFKKMGTRAKEAWKSTESFASIFERFKGGSGLGNFIEMIGEMLDNLITRIGKTVAALFGFEDVVTSGKVGTAFESVKNFLQKVMTVFGWLYTNVIRPTLKTLVVGMANMLKEVGDAWRSGDILKILEIITKTFKAIGSLQLFKVLQALSRTFGSTGIIKVLRNGAKALKSLSRYLGAKAVNEVSSAIMKLVVSFGILLGILTAMSFLPTENLKKVSDLLIYAGIALGVMMVAMTTLSIVATKTRWGLVGIAGSMISIVAATWTFIFVVNKIKEAIDEFVEDDSLGGIVAALLPIIGVIVAMLLVFKTAAKIGNSGGLIAFAGAIAGLSIGVMLLVTTLDNMVDFLSDTTIEEALGAIGAIFLLMSAVAVTAGLMMRIVGKSLGGIRTAGSAITMSLTIITITLTTALIVIPLLENMVQNSERFPEYMEALGIFCLTMISISASFALMTSRTRGGFHALAAGIVFRIFVNTIEKFILPMLEQLKGIKVDDYLGGILAVAALTVGISVGVERILKGIAACIAAMALINWKSWLAIVLGTAGAIAGVMLLAEYLESTGVEVNVGTVLAAIGTVLAIIIAFGLLSVGLLKLSFGNALTITALAKVFKWMSIIIITIIGGLAGTLALLRLLYNGEEGKGLKHMLAFAGIMVGLIALTLLSFGIFIGMLHNSISIIPDANLKQIKNILIVILGGMVGIMAAFMLYSIIINENFTRWGEYAAPLITIVLSILFTIGGVLAEIAIFLNLLPTLTFNKGAVAIVIATLATVLLSILAISLVLIPAFKNMRDVDWEIILSLLAGLALLIFSISILTVGAAKIGTWQKILTTLLVCVGILAAIAIFLPEIADAFNAFRGADWGDFLIMMLSFLVPFGAILATIITLTSVAPAFAAAAGNIALGFTTMAVAIAGLAIAFGLFKEMVTPGSTLIGRMLLKGEAEGIEKESKNTIETMVDTQEKMQDETEKANKLGSPSKLYKTYGKWIDQGLAQGITKNEKVALKAAEGLAIVTNEAFCDELGIQSPSKVFYENGRFVVRGFINGVNSESNKNKQAGLDMADGFGEGMDQAMESIKDDWKGLWSDTGIMESDIDNAMKEISESGAGVFSSTLLDNLMGTDEVVVTQLTAAEAQELSRLQGLQKERDEALKELEEGWNAPHDESYKAARKDILKNYPSDLDKQIKDIESKAGQKQKKSGGLSSIFSGSIGDALDNLLGDSTIKDKLGEVGSSIGDGIMGIFNTDSSEGSKFTDKVSGWFGGVLTTLGLKSESTAEDVGNDTGEVIATNTSDSMETYFTGTTFLGNLSAVGDRIGQVLSDSIFGKMKRALEDFLFYNSLAGYAMKLANMFGIIGDEEFELYERERKARNNKNEESTVSLSILNKNNEVDLDADEERLKLAIQKKNELYDLNKEYQNINKDQKYYEKLQKINDKYNNLNIGNAELIEKAYQGGIQLKNAYTDQNYVKTQLYTPFENWIKKSGIYEEGKDYGEYFQLGFREGYLYDHSGTLIVVSESMDEFLNLIKKDKLNEASPSKEAISIMDYFMQGLAIGVEEGVPDLLNTVDDMTNLMTEETIAGLNAMADAVNDETIQPSITPVFDDTNIQNGIYGIDRTFSGLNKAVQATVDSFQDKSYNYTSEFDTLANGIMGTNMLLQSLCDTLEQGGIIDVNVNAETDSNNLFNFVIDKGKEEWKRTGRNRFNLGGA